MLDTLLIISVILNICNEISSTTEFAENLKGNVFATVLVNKSANITSTFKRRKSSAQYGLYI